MIACFMAKPFTERAGSGMHIHVSLNDAEGVNLMSAGETETNELLLHTIGGMAAPPCKTAWRFSPRTRIPIGVLKRIATHPRLPLGGLIIVV